MNFLTRMSKSNLMHKLLSPFMDSPSGTQEKIDIYRFLFLFIELLLGLTNI